jgi:serine protease
MLSLLFLLSEALAKRYIITTKTPVLIVQEKQIIENSIKIGDITFHFVDSPEPPFYMYGNADVIHIEEDSIISKNSLYNLQENPDWHLDRVDQRSARLNGKYFSHTSGGKGVLNYVVDTGIDVKHPEFEGRATWGGNFADSEGPDGCMDSHGTHVAGIIGSKTFGVAKDTALISVKVLDCKGSGRTSNVLRGIDYIVKDKLKGFKVINLSLGGGVSIALNRAVKEATNKNIFVLAAAGNENSDACNTSPASEPSAITVGAFEKGDKISYFSNWGKCVDIFSPGSRIKSTVPRGGTETFDGTSQATPIVAGIVSLILSSSVRTKPITPEEMKQFLSKTSTKDILSGNLRGSPDQIVFSLSYMV